MIKFKKIVLIPLFILVGVAFSGNSAVTSLKKALPSKITIAMDTCHYNYFITNGYPAGYQFEIIEHFANYCGAEYEIVVVANDSSRIGMLKSGKAHIAVFSHGPDSIYNIIASKRTICSSIPLDEHFKSVWLTNIEHSDLNPEINSWASIFKGQKNYDILQAKYFKNKHKKSHAQISQYDALLKKYSKTINWDWRLLASIMYNESMFRHNATSKQGAAGLMQLMPQTVQKFGVNNVYNPEENIRGGVKLLGYLQDYALKSGIPESEVVNFVLASYNAGHGRVEHCRKFTEAYGLNPNNWKEVMSVIPLMKNPDQEMLKKFQLKKFNGTETITFVSRVNEYYSHYKNYFNDDV